MSNHKKNSKIKELILLFLSIMFSLILAEVIISNVLPQNLVKYKLDPDTVHRPRENIKSEVETTEYHTTYKTNSKGLHDYEYDYNFTGFTIVMLGDSFTEGLQVNMDDRFAEILERRLIKNVNALRVINCGMGNTGTDQQYIYLKKECIEYNPDVVILNFYVGNDFANNYNSLIYGYENGTLVDERPLKFSLFQKTFHFLNTRFHTTKLLEKIFLKSNFLRIMLSKIGLYKTRELLDYDMNLYDQFFLKYDTNISEIGYIKTFLILDQLINYTKYNNITLAVSILPSREQVATRKYFERFSVYNNTDMYKPNRRLIAYLNSRGIAYIDLLPDFRKENKNNSFYYEEDDHFNVEGHKLAADVVYNGLLQKGILKQ